MDQKDGMDSPSPGGGSSSSPPPPALPTRSSRTYPGSATRLHPQPSRPPPPPGPGGESGSPQRALSNSSSIGGSSNCSSSGVNNNNSTGRGPPPRAMVPLPTTTIPGSGSGSGGTSSSGSRTRAVGGSASSTSVIMDSTTIIGSPLGRSSTSTHQAVFVRPLSRSQLAPVHERRGVSSIVGEVPGGGRGSSSLLGTSVPPLPSTTMMMGSSRVPPSPPARPISLDKPRPDSERHRNVYLGTPMPLNLNPMTPSPQLSPPGGGGGKVRVESSRSSSSVTAAEQVRLPTNSRTGLGGGSVKGGGGSGGGGTCSSHEGGSVVTTQPLKGTLLEESSEGGKVNLVESSILCPVCRKCRCEACGTPRPLPSRWICSKSIHCGPEPLLDYVTCLCCVKAMFYHCGKNHEGDGGVMCADKPCSCVPHRKYWRWGLMTTMSLVLPCLCLYWPCKGTLKVVEKVYQRTHSHGCSCRPHPVSSSNVTNRTNNHPTNNLDPIIISQMTRPSINRKQEDLHTSDSKSTVIDNTHGKGHHHRGLLLPPHPSSRGTTTGSLHEHQEGSQSVAEQGLLPSLL